MARLGNFDVKSLSDVVRFNEQNAAIALPKRSLALSINSYWATHSYVNLLAHEDQEDLIKALNGTTSEEDYLNARVVCKRLAREECLEKIMDHFNLDVIAAPSDSPIVGFSACAGMHCLFKELHPNPS